MDQPNQATIEVLPDDGQVLESENRAQLDFTEIKKKKLSYEEMSVKARLFGGYGGLLCSQYFTELKLRFQQKLLKNQL
jgi:hypothetical protein